MIEHSKLLRGSLSEGVIMVGGPCCEVNDYSNLLQMLRFDTLNKLAFVSLIVHQSTLDHYPKLPLTFALKGFFISVYVT